MDKRVAIDDLRMNDELHCAFVNIGYTLFLDNRRVVVMPTFAKNLPPYKRTLINVIEYENGKLSFHAFQRALDDILVYGTWMAFVMSRDTALLRFRVPHLSTDGCFATHGHDRLELVFPSQISNAISDV